LNGQTSIRSFLIADIRGYSRYTGEFGDEAAALLTARFVELVTEGVETHGGEVVEIRGDEALAVFTSARQAIRGPVYLQGVFAEEAETDHDLPLRVGIGIDS
jgi:class 3 adenylate cyclase